MSEDLPAPSGEFLLYTGSDGKVKVECRFLDETLWLTQRLMADLFGVGVPAINKHLKNIYESGELAKAATVSKMETVRSEGSRQALRCDPLLAGRRLPRLHPRYACGGAHAPNRAHHPAEMPMNRPFPLFSCVAGLRSNV